MFALTEQQRFLLYSQPTDMRKGFNGLSGLVRNELGQDPTDESVYIFINKKRDKIKLLHWLGNGFLLYYKELEQGTFESFNYDESVQSITLSYSKLVMLMDGLTIKNIVQRKRYDYPQKTVNKTSQNVSVNGVL